MLFFEGGRDLRFFLSEESNHGKVNLFFIHKSVFSGNEELTPFVADIVHQAANFGIFQIFRDQGNKGIMISVL